MIKCLSLFHRWTRSVWLKCSVIQWRRKWSWIILSLIRSIFHLVRVTLYRLRVAQRTNRSSNSDQCWQHTTGSVNTPRYLWHRNNHCNAECEWSLPVRIGVLWRERIPHHCNRLLHDRFHECPWDPIDPRIRIKCASERTGQSTIILPEYLVQLNSGDQRHHVLRAIDVFWILYISGVHRSSE